LAEAPAKNRVWWLLPPLIALLALGGLNIARKISWKEPTDGIVWEIRPGGLTAIKVEKNGPGDTYGNIKKGDILLAINDIPVTNRIDLMKSFWRAAASGQKVTYQISRQGELLPPSIMLGQKGVDLIYLYLALIGLMTLVIGLIVYSNSAKPFAVPNIYYYLLSAFLYGFYVFSPTGQLDFLDNVFYWLDKLAFLAFPPLLLHFFLIFPQRKPFLKRKPSFIVLLYLPAGLLLLTKLLLRLPAFAGLESTLVLRVYGWLEKVDLLHFALYTSVTLATIADSYFRHPSFVVRKQLKWIVIGLGLGILPFTLLYVIPFLAGAAPSRVAELTVLLQALVPLSFSYSISRYKLMDLEVILKKSGTLVFSYFVLALVYLGISSQTKIFSEYRVNAILLGLMAIILGGTVYTPLRRLVQSLFDKVFYRRSYEYRRTLLSISKELSRERNLENLSRALLELIANALDLDRIALYLPAEDRPGVFDPFSSRGEFSLPPGPVALPEDVAAELKEHRSLTLYPLADRRDRRPAVEALRGPGFEHLLALSVEDQIIGCLAMGRKTDATFLTSEDWELLATISSPVALALENATLYNQASLRAQELERLKDYSENIIESLTVGVAVLDRQGRVIGWNRVLEETFGRSKAGVLGRSLLQALGPGNFASIFPPDTQEEYHLLSETALDMPAGGKRIFDIAKTPLLDNGLNPYGTILVFEDITERIRLQQQLVTSEKLASIGLLSAGVAHEINTPLTGISSYVQMLQKRVTEAHFAQILEKIEAQTERVSRIVKNLLNFARNPSDLAFHRVSLKDSLQEIISLIEYKLKAMNIRLELELAPVDPLWAQGERLQQVFINIILNALDAMPGGGVLRIELSETARDAVVVITDTGMGIKDQHIAHVFDPFFTTKGVGKGTGLGLSISYAIVTEHDGRIGVRSEPGRGTRFTIEIPKDLDKRRRPAPKAEPAPPARESET
jgi:two-component system, NtrC family, sensor kinase